MREENLGQEVILTGWCQTRRDHGGVIFLDIRDLEGICQAVIDPSNDEAFSLADKCRSEFVIQIKGNVRERPEGTINSKMKTAFESEENLALLKQAIQASPHASVLEVFSGKDGKDYLKEFFHNPL